MARKKNGKYTSCMGILGITTEKAGRSSWEKVVLLLQQHVVCRRACSVFISRKSPTAFSAWRLPWHGVSVIVFFYCVKLQWLCLNSPINCIKVPKGKRGCGYHERRRQILHFQLFKGICMVSVKGSSIFLCGWTLPLCACSTVLFLHIIQCCGPADGASPYISHFKAVLLCMSMCSLIVNHTLSWSGVQG